MHKTKQAAAATHDDFKTVCLPAWQQHDEDTTAAADWDLVQLIAVQAVYLTADNCHIY